VLAVPTTLRRTLDHDAGASAATTAVCLYQTKAFDCQFTFTAMSLSNRVERALDALRFRCLYKLGRGGFNSLHPVNPAWDGGRSDCSGFVSYVLMTRRSPKEARPFWIETTMVYNDAVGAQRAFRAIPKPIPGCLVVYGDRKGSEGHIGVVVSVSGDTYATVECASGILGRTGKAIRKRENAQTLFGSKKAIFCLLKGDKEL
jgi:hypothetical protein